CLAIAPTFLDDASLGGFADVPLAAVLAATLAAWLTWVPGELTLRSPVPWLVAGLLTVKTEGVVLFWTVIAVALVAWGISRIRGVAVAVSPSWAALLLGALLLRFS